jgi:putative transposase
MARRELRDDQWKQIKELLPGKESDPGRTGRDNRLFVDAVLWIARTGAHWRELPDRFGAWNSVFQRYNRWARSGVWERLFIKLSDDPDFEYVMIDATIVRAHQHSAGAKGGLKRRKPLAAQKVG